MTRIRVRDVVRATADVHAIPYTVLVGPRRHAQTVRARHIAMLMAKRLTDASLNQIAGALGGRDHTTVLHGIRKAGGYITPMQEAAIASRVRQILDNRPPAVEVKDERFIEARCERYFDERAYGIVRLSTGEQAYIPRLALAQNCMAPPAVGDRLFVEVGPGKWGLEVRQAAPYRIAEGA